MTIQAGTGSSKSLFSSNGKFGHFDWIKIQDPVSATQKTGWTIHFSFLVLSGLKKSFTLDVNHFPVYWDIFGMVTNEQTTNRVILE